MARLYTNTNGSKPYYDCTVTYGSVTRSGTTVTVHDVVLTLDRISGYTYNGVNYCAGRSSGAKDIKNNVVIHSWGGAMSDSKYTVNIGNVDYPNILGTSVHLYVVVASVGAQNDTWGNFQGNSPLTVFDSDITCPAATPTFTTQPTAARKSETEITLSCGVTDIASYIYYSIDNGSTWNATTSSSETIGGLTANTSYTIKVQARNASDTSLTTTVTLPNRITTYPYPSIATSPSGWPGDVTMDTATKTVNFTFNNPLNRVITMTASIGTYSVSGTTTSTTGSLALDCDLIYNQIPSATSGNITFSMSATGASDSTIKAVYAVESYAKPSVKTSGFIWQAVHPSNFSTIFTNTGKMIQNKSYMKVKYDRSLSNIGTPNKGAQSISAATITFGERNAQTLTNSLAAYVSTTTVFNYAIDQNAIITVTDSRGYSNSATVIIPFVAYSAPVATITAARVGGYGTNVTLSLSGTCSNVGTNSITKLEWKAGESGSWNTITSISGGSATVTTSLSSNQTQNYYCRATDGANITSSQVSFEVGVGEPIVFIDTDHLGVGINQFPEGEGLYVNKINGSTVTALIQDTVTSLIQNTIQTTIQNTVYPIGSIFMSTTHTDPSTYTYLTGTTWIEWGSGKVPVGVDTNQTEFNTVEKTGGNKELAQHNHTIESHTHTFSGTASGDFYIRGGTASGTSILAAGTNTTVTKNQYDHWANGLSVSSTGITGNNLEKLNYNSTVSGNTGGSGQLTTNNTGSGDAGNLQPYITCYMWKRIA